MGWGATSLAQALAWGACGGHRKDDSAHLSEGGWGDAQLVATSCPKGLMSQPKMTPFGPEHARRLEIFARNLAWAQQLQEDSGTAEFGVTPFSDLTGTGTRYLLVLMWWVEQRLAQGTGRWTGQTIGFHFPERPEY